jgi:transcriptional regulator with XRE-family HTH domain
MTKVGTYKQEAYDQALAFRRRGFTYAEIAKICNVSKGTVSNWLRHEPFSQVVSADNKKQAVAQNKKRLALINKARVSERKHQYAEVIRLAETEYKHYRTSPLFIAGLTLYLSRGDKQTATIIRFSSGDADQQKLFVRFVREFLGVPSTQVRVWLLLYPTHDEVKLMKYWCRALAVSPSSFHKNQVIQSRSTKETLQFGVLNTIIGSTLLKKKLLHWTTLLTKELKNL